MTKKEEILLVVRCAVNHAVYKKSCSGWDDESLCKKIQALLRERFPRFKNPSL